MYFLNVATFWEFFMKFGKVFHIAVQFGKNDFHKVQVCI